MKHKKKAVVSVVLCFILMINGFTNRVQATTSSDEYWPEEPSVTAGAAIVMDVNTGAVLYEKNSTQKHYPASITKILTSLVAIENASLSDTVTFSKDAVFNIEKGSSLCGIDWGEELSLEDCLYGILLESGNEVSYAVAENVGGTYEDFVDMMNAKAEELGCVNSHFANPHGLTEEDHYTCAYDMALIAQAAIKNTAFAKIVGARTHTVEPTNKQPETRYWANHHKFVKKSLNYDGCIGGKTGWTSKSKYTLVTYAKRGDMTLVCVIMDEESATNQYTETATLLDYGFDNFTISSIKDAESNDSLDNSMFFNQYNTALSETNPLLSISEDGYVILPNGVNLSDAQREVVYSGSEEVTDSDAVTEDSNTNDSDTNRVKSETADNIFTKEIGTVTYTYRNQVIGKGTLFLNLMESQLLTSIDSVIETKEGDQSEDTVESGLSASDDSVNDNRIGTETQQDQHTNLKPIIVAVIIAGIVILSVLYYFTIERPRIRRRKRYLEHRRNHRYDS